MTKYIIGVCCGMLIIASLISLGLHESEMAYILGFSKLWIIGRLLLASSLLAYYLFLSVRRRAVTLALRVIGVSLLYMSLSSILGGSSASGTFVPIVDIVLALEGGIVCLLASLDLPQYESTAPTIATLKLNVVNMMKLTAKGKLRTASH